MVTSLATSDSSSTFTSERAFQRVLVWFDSSNHVHRDLAYHPECPERITTCVQALATKAKDCVLLTDIANEEDGYRRDLLANDEDNDALIVSSTPFTDDQLAYARSMLLQTHSNDAMVTGLEKSCAKARKERLESGRPGGTLGHMGYVDSGDTYVTTESFGVVLRATAAWIQAVDVALTGSPTLALTRPPGHHATRDTANGFCLVNFAATAALHAIQKYPERVQWVAIVDWDVHYGQGVADIVEQYPKQIRYVSIHQVPAFPYMGQSKQFNAQGNVWTLPMPPDTTWTCGYQDLWEQALDFAIGSSKDDDWNPDLVIVCAGYDALSSDDLASCALTASDFGKMTRALRQRLVQRVKQQSSPKPLPALMLGLEGGYQLQDAGASGNLAEAVVETVRALAE